MQGQKTRKSYRIQLTGGQLLWISVLSFMSLGVSFYLGLVTGNSLRSPIEKMVPVENNAVSSSSAQKPSKSLPVEDLKFFNTIENQQAKSKGVQKKVFSAGQLERLKGTTTRLKKETENLQTEPSPPKISESKPAEQPVSPSKPILVQSKQVGFYTLQVFTSSSQKKAEELVKRLLDDGFIDAYLQTFKNAENKTLYRIRVAKVKKEAAEILAEKLKKLSYIDHVQIARL